MLSRTAESLYWMARYIERAETMARLLDVGRRMSALSPDAEGDATEWQSTLTAAGCAGSFFARYERLTAEAAIRHVARDAENPSSIFSCLETARRNARAVRTALTVDMWEAINATWLELAHFGEADFAPERLPRFVDCVNERSLLIDGAATSTMMRNDAYWFVRLGTFVERADSTARILDVKYHVLLPEYETVGGGVDYYQWAAILRSVSALRAYHWVYRDRVKPWQVAELLILRPEMPRSLMTCLDEIAGQLDTIAKAYGARGESHRLAGRIHAGLHFGRMDDIFEGGLHEFLARFIDDNAALGDEIAKQYLV